jgi:aflatoxin B1 aldehyde reductase
VDFENGSTKGGRWDRNTNIGKLYHALYYKPSFLKMLEKYGKLAEESGVGKAGMAYRWVRYHSSLKGELGDMMIIGASNPKQLEETLTELEKGPLDEKVVERLDELWKLVEPDAAVDNLEVAKTLDA